MEPTFLGLDLPPRDALASLAWCDERAERLTRAVAGDAATPFMLVSSEDREDIDTDRGQVWPVGYRGKIYSLGAFECRVSYSWARESELREYFSVTLLRASRFLLGLTLRSRHIAVPAGPGRFCVQRHEGGSQAELDALVRFLRAESKG